MYLEGDEIGVSEEHVGFIFAIRALAYAIMSVFTPSLAKKFHRKYVIFTGIILVFFANSFMGSAKYFFLPT